MLRRAQRPSAQLDNGRRAESECRDRDLLLQRAKRAFPARLEELGDRDTRARLDEIVDGDERPAEARGQLRAERRLARAHEADEGEMAP